MKKLLCILLSGATLFAAEGQMSAEDGKKDIKSFSAGIGPMFTTDGFGLSYRAWVKGALGFSLNVSSSWDREIEGGELQVNYKFDTPTLLKPYLLIGGGLQRLNLDDITPAVYNEPVGTFVAGAGMETFMGESQRHGLSMEIAYTYGRTEYTGKVQNGVGETVLSKSLSKSVPIFSLGLLYHFYFIPAK